MNRNYFETWAASHKVSLHLLFPTRSFSEVVVPNMGAGSPFFGKDPQHEDLVNAHDRLQAFQQEHPNALLANGYLEQRSFYNTPNYKRETTAGIEYRNIHLGTDFWVPVNTPVHSLYDGKVVIAHNNDQHKDYGPVIVVEHEMESETFYTLYGHMSLSTLELSPKGKMIMAGERIGFIGNQLENGHWVPHLHFQIITDLMERLTTTPAFVTPLNYLFGNNAAQTPI
ncbi:MAG: peptidoglycan DD-metalloendopeptidase family protein [Bacteroidia bacterium]|nr:peptidoglycan DD-metalloendopeptidase family protein [Bacteroidia bacterium]